MINVDSGDHFLDGEWKLFLTAGAEIEKVWEEKKTPLKLILLNIPLMRPHFAYRAI
jgi:hypothetical protein